MADNSEFISINLKAPIGTKSRIVKQCGSAYPPISQTQFFAQALMEKLERDEKKMEKAND